MKLNTTFIVKPLLSPGVIIMLDGFSG
jgi:hypothetical protein